jgi:hypothetical protein
MVGHLIPIKSGDACFDISLCGGIWQMLTAIELHKSTIRQKSSTAGQKHNDHDGCPW